MKTKCVCVYTCKCICVWKIISNGFSYPPTKGVWLVFHNRYLYQMGSFCYLIWVSALKSKHYTHTECITCKGDGHNSLIDNVKVALCSNCTSGLGLG